MRFDPRKQQPDLVVSDSIAPGSHPRVLIELMKLDSSGGTAIDWFVPSRDGRKVAVSLSKGGSEEGTLHIYEVAQRREIGESSPGSRSELGGGSLAWTADGKGFWYTRYPRVGERPAPTRISISRCISTSSEPQNLR